MLSKSDVENLANLARLKLADEEMEAILPKLDSILTYIGEVSAIVTDDLPAAPGLTRNVLREDSVKNNGGEYTQSILENAPAREGDYLKVKQIF